MSEAPLSSEQFIEQVNVSRETIEKCETYLELLIKWQKTINLVSASTLADPWRRHFLDSAQLLPFIPGGEGSIIDMGSGAGFPGMVLSLCGVKEIHLVESDHRKAQFLREVARTCGSDAHIHAQRIEEAGIQQTRMIVARALAPLDMLLNYALPFVEQTNGECLFLKGVKADQEIEKAQKNWQFDLEKHQSLSHSQAAVLHIKNLIKK